METPSEDLGVEVRILLKWILQELYKSLERVYLDQSIEC
jgi:hypothetical protein